MADQPRPDELEGTEQPFVSHLIELRDRMVRALIAVGICFGVLAVWPGPAGLYDLLAQPLVAHLPEGTKLIATNVISPFMVPLKITLFVALLGALPYVLYQVWAFVAPGLYQHEKRLALPVIVSSVLMFFAGIAYCYFVVFRVVFRFIARFAPGSVSVTPDIDAYFSFVLRMFVAFGVTFEVPIAVLLMVRLGITSIARLRQARPYVIVGAFVVAAIFTPPDVLSQLLLALPLCLLFELGVLLAAVFGVSPQARSESGPAAG